MGRRIAVQRIQTFGAIVFGILNPHRIAKLHKLIDYTKAFETKYEQFENGGKNLVIRNKG